MELPKNHFKAAILAGQQQLGLWSQINDATVSELLAGCGFDWMVLDCEHSPIDTATVLPMLQAMASYPVQPVVRARSLNPAEIKKLLDYGAQNILVPYVQNAEEARLAAASVDYPPSGIRGVAGGTRAGRFGRIANYHRIARQEICLIIQIETVEALNNLDEILKVDGIDAIFIGPADLAASMGYPGDASNPAVRETAIDAVRRIRAAGKPCGFLTRDEGFLDEVVAAGNVFTAIDIDIMVLRLAAEAKVNHWRKKFGKD
jgi:4-hydroxy-2-oxoheptanedioate aldolase